MVNYMRENRHMNVLGQNIMRLRIGRGLTQEELSRMAGLTQPGVSNLETGQTENPELDTLRRLARALGVQVGVLLMGAEQDGLDVPP